MAHTAPLHLHQEKVLPEWTDYNGHLNESYYLLIFSHACDFFLDYIGLDQAGRDRQQCSLFTLENHINYLLEVKQGATVRIETRIVKNDTKRIQLYHEMFREGESEMLAAAEQMLIHIDLKERKSAPMRPETQKIVDEIAAAHLSLPPAKYSGRQIGIRG